METKRMASANTSCSRRDNYLPKLLLDIYIYDYFVRRKLYATARLFKVERNINRDTLQLGMNREPVGDLWRCWSTFWNIYFSKHHNKKNHPPTGSLVNQVARTQNLVAAFPSYGTETIRARVKKYLDDGRIPKNFLKLLGDEDIPFKTPLTQSTPSLKEFQSSKVPLIIIDDDEEEEERRSPIISNNDNLFFNPEELLKLLDGAASSRRRTVKHLL